MVDGRGTVLGIGIERRFDLLRERAVRLFPALATVAWPYRWGGLVAITTDQLPHFTSRPPA
jgi:glycine/D-amino acid oxidase-like deaminating enzyme